MAGVIFLTTIIQMGFFNWKHICYISRECFLTYNCYFFGNHPCSSFCRPISSSIIDRTHTGAYKKIKMSRHNPLIQVPISRLYNLTRFSCKFDYNIKRIYPFEIQIKDNIDTVKSYLNLNSYTSRNCKLVSVEIKRNGDRYQFTILKVLSLCSKYQLCLHIEYLSTQWYDSQEHVTLMVISLID